MHIFKKKIKFVSPLKKLWWSWYIALTVLFGFWFFATSKVVWKCQMNSFFYCLSFPFCAVVLAPSWQKSICMFASTQTHAHRMNGLLWKHVGLLSLWQQEQYTCTSVTSSVCWDFGKMVWSSLWAAITDVHTLFHRELGLGRRFCKLTWLRMFQSVKVYNA